MPAPSRPHHQVTRAARLAAAPSRAGAPAGPLRRARGRREPRARLQEPARGAGAPAESEEGVRRGAAERLVLAVLGVADQLADAPLLLGSPQAASLLVALPDWCDATWAKIFGGRPSAEDVVRRIQARARRPAPPCVTLTLCHIRA